ncbi:hypothetical protein PIB30_055139 [Stylosanthes scabra]|uniref:Uncharacterized protein n=1 Tax=Stylosanthes scabra TaxID=79078 RepID=A0ABU6QJR5_9FABA|nr:hypothetical protein [Stylosanthes scabra]
MINAYGPLLSPNRGWSVRQLWADVRWVRYGFGLGKPNIRNSCPRARKVGESELFELSLIPKGSSVFRTANSTLGEMADIQENDLDGVVREVEEAQMPHELDPLYNWVNWDVLGSPCTMTEDYLMS